MINRYSSPNTTKVRIKSMCINGGVSWTNDAFATCLEKTVPEVEAAKNRLIKRADGSSFFKYGNGPTTMAFTAAESTHTRECVATDSFTLNSSPATQYWAFDKSYPKI